MNRRDFARVVGIVVLGGLAGCGRPIPSADFEDAVALTKNVFRGLLLGSEERDVTAPTKPDPPLLRAGVYETVLIATDVDGFARVSQGSLPSEAVADVNRRVAEDLNRDLQRRNFGARAVVFGADVRNEQKALLATLTPTTQEGGSPRERAEGKGRTYILIRLTITDPKTGVLLSQRDYYSGRDVKREGDIGPRRVRAKTPT